MPVTIETPSVTTVLPEVVAPLVQIKQDWSGTWQLAPELLATHLSSASAGQDLGRLVFHRRYGTTKDTYQAAFATRANIDLTDWWIRVQAVVAGDPAPKTIWIGRVSGDDAAQFASSSVAAGIQQWVAYGPAQIIHKRAVGKSYFVQPAGVVEIGWIPPLNDPTLSEVGNRSENMVDGVFVYGGEKLWNYREYAEYLIEKFLDEFATGGPAWGLTGQADALESLSAPIRWGTTQTLSQMLRRLIPLDRGLDYVVRSVPAEGGGELGFEIFVFAVNQYPQSFAGYTLPGNPALVTLEAGTASDLSPPLRVVMSNDRKYKRIRVLGKRIVVCCSLWGANAPNRSQVGDNVIGVPPVTGGLPSTIPTLVKCWGDDIETEYKEVLVSPGDPDEEDADHDAYRRQDKFHDVYASFGAPFDWDFNSGTALPWVDDEGNIKMDDEETEGEDESEAPYQNWLRNTLTWIPLKEGEDWSEIASAPTFGRGTLTDVDDHQADYLPPIAWVFDPTSYCYVISTQLGVGVRPKRHDWGVLLRCSPNHIMGDNHFDEVGETYKTATWPRYDWEELIVTLAFESDQRYTMEWYYPDATAADGVKEITVDAELHYLAPNTVVAADWPDYTPNVILSGDTGRVIRADRELMGLTMAGAITRYGWGRDRARISVKGLCPWHDLVGQILFHVQESGSSRLIGGVISGVTWDMPLNGSPTTTIRAGFAQ